MQSNLLLFFLASVLVVISAIYINKWLIKWINPRASGARLVFYFLAVLSLGLVITIGFSYLMLSLFFHRK